jgi:hypothetical protein
VFNGTESWKVSEFQYDESNTRYDYADTMGPGQGSAICLSTHFAHNGVSKVGMWTNQDRLNYAEFRILWAYDTVEELKEFLAAQYSVGTPVECIYILATPIETPLSETEIAAYRAMHSNYPNTTVLNDAGAHMVVKYAADTKLYIDNKIAALLGGA